MILPVYNLEFRPRSTRLEIDGYTFERVPDYCDQRARLEHRVDSFGSEFRTVAATGVHAHTANVFGPDVGSPSIIHWHPPSTALNDILLLLKLFTGRDVFARDVPLDRLGEPFLAPADPRMCPWGGVLVCSLPYQCEEAADPFETIDTTLQVHLPPIYDRMKTPEWQRQYKQGYFLILLGHAIQQRTLESAFVQCWTICEHLFACLTDSWMSKRTIQQLDSKDKIAFLLVHFGVRVELAELEKSRIDDLVGIRNRLIHFGQFPVRDKVHHDAELFIQITEYFAAKALGLYPSRVFNTVDRLEEFLDSKASGSTKRS